MATGGVMTLAEMRTELRYNLDNRTDISDAQLTRWLQRTYFHVGQPDIFRHRELQGTQLVTCVAQTFAYPIEDDAFAIYTVRNNTVGFKLRPRTYMFIQELTRHFGRAAYYALWERDLILFPTPDTQNAGQVLDVSYYKRPGNLTDSGAAASVLTPEWDEIIIEGAKWRAWRTLNQPERALDAKETFGALINEMTQTLRVDGEDSGFGVELQGLDNYMARG